MAASLILKDKGRKTMGYVMRIADEIVCKLVENREEEAMLTILLDDGTRAEFPVPADGREHRFSVRQQGLSGAYAARRGVLFAATDEAARDAFYNARHTEEKKSKKSETLCKKEGDSAVNHIEEFAAKKEIGVAAASPCFPQRRWPPPPCQQDARYVDGSWREEEMGRDILA